MLLVVGLLALNWQRIGRVPMMRKENLLLRKMQRPIRDWGLHASYQYLNGYVNTGLLSEVLLSCEKVSFKGLSWLSKLESLFMKALCKLWRWNRWWKRDFSSGGVVDHGLKLKYICSWIQEFCWLKYKLSALDFDVVVPAVYWLPGWTLLMPSWCKWALVYWDKLPASEKLNANAWLINYALKTWNEVWCMLLGGLVLNIQAVLDSCIRVSIGTWKDSAKIITSFSLFCCLLCFCVLNGITLNAWNVTNCYGYRRSGLEGPPFHNVV